MGPHNSLMGVWDPKFLREGYGTPKSLWGGGGGLWDPKILMGGQWDPRSFYQWGGGISGTPNR